MSAYDLDYLVVILLINYCYFSIYRQICDSSPPLHPVLPALLEVFVNSALVPASNRGSPDQTVNEPISEHEIRAVFQVRVTKDFLRYEQK